MGFFKFWGHALRHSFSKGGHVFAFMSGSLPMGIIQAFCLSYAEEWKTVSWFVWVNSHLPHLYVCFALTYMAFYLFYAPYKLYRELEAKTAADKSRFENENQELRKLDLENQSQRATEGVKRAEDVGREYAKLWRARGMPDEPGARMRCLIDAEILGVEHVPNGLDIVLSAARIAGASNPLQGWEKEHLFEFVNWAVTRKEGLPSFSDEISLFHEWTEAYLADCYASGGTSSMRCPWAPMYEDGTNQFSSVVMVTEEDHLSLVEGSTLPAAEPPPALVDAAREVSPA